MGESQEAETEEPETAMEDLVPRQNISGNFYMNPPSSVFMLWIQAFCSGGSGPKSAFLQFKNATTLQVFYVQTIKKSFG